MAHEFESGFFGDNRPAWHGLGTVIPQDVVTSAEAIKLAGLDWQVETRPVYCNGSSEPGAGDVGPSSLSLVGATGFDAREIPDARAVVRLSDGRPLGVVGPRYVPLQNAEQFDFMDSIVGSGQAMYHTAGSLRHGQRIWLLAKLPGTVQIAGEEDSIHKFLLLSNSHDGSGMLRVLFTPTRVVCMNTLSSALSEGKGQGIAIRHTAGLKTKVAQAQKLLGLAVEYYQGFESKLKNLYATPFSDGQMVEVVDAILPRDDDGTVSTRNQNMRDKVLELWSGSGQGMKMLTGTAYGAFNAAVEWIDHHRSTRVTAGKNESEQRMEAIVFGQGAALKATAMEAIETEIAKAA